MTQKSRHKSELLILVCANEGPLFKLLSLILHPQSYLISRVSPDSVTKIFDCDDDDFEIGIMPDAVMIDLITNREQGLNNCRALCQKITGMAAPIIALVAEGDYEAVDLALGAGASDFLMQPIIPRALEYRLEYLLHRTLISRQRVWPRRLKTGSDINSKDHLALTIGGYDVLTGLPEAALFRKLATRKLNFMDDVEPVRAALMLITLDHFRRVKSILGLPASDELLRRVVDRIEVVIFQFLDSLPGRSRLPDDILVGRLGPDEFAILIPEIVSNRNAANLARTILAAVSKPAASKDSPAASEDSNVYLTAMVGVTMAPTDGKDIDTLIQNAEAIMHHNSPEGRDSFHFYTSGMIANATRRMELEAELSRALHENALTLYFQPLVEISSGNIWGVEALLRWQHPQLGLLTPEVFITIAEDVGLIAEIGEWVLRQACRQCREWQVAGFDSLSISINISPYQFRRLNMDDLVAQALAEADLAPEFLTLEVTESLVIQDVEATLQTMGKLKNMGVRLALDDFGTGYSSLSYLHSLSVDYLKIDRSFVKELPDHAGGLAVTEAIIRVANALQLGIVAEGIETSEQLECLHKLGCDIYQGFYFSEPLPYDETSNLLKARWKKSEYVQK